MTSENRTQFRKILAKWWIWPLFLVLIGLGSIGATVWTKQASVFFSGLLALFSALLWKTNHDFNKWSRDQYEPTPGIVGGELHKSKTSGSIDLEMINPGQTVLFYKATKLNECDIKRFLIEDRFENNVEIKPHAVEKVTLESPIKGEGRGAELKKFLEESDRVLLDIYETYYSGKKKGGQRVWNITFRKKEGSWKIMPSFLADVEEGDREEGD